MEKDYFSEQNIPYAPLPLYADDSRYGNDLLTSVTGLQVGFGAKVLRVDRSGLWMGGETFATAPLSFDMLGNAIFNSLTLVGGTIKFGKTSFTDSTHAGYYISSSGLYFGSASDSSLLKYDIVNDTFAVKAQIETLAGSILSTSYLNGLIPQANLNIADRGWSQTCVFSSTTLNKVSWTSGIFTSADGTAYNILAGDTGIMSAKTYIYLDIAVSTTTYRTTTNSTTAVGIGKVLIGVAQNDATAATFALTETTQIVGDNILVNTIDASKIKTGQLFVGTNVGLGTAKQNFTSTPTTPYYVGDLWTAGSSGDIKKCIVQRLTGAYVSADWALASKYTDDTAVTNLISSLGSLAYDSLVGEAQLDTTVIVGGYIKTSLLTADNIIAGTFTGLTFQTASTGKRVVIASLDNSLKFYDADGPVVDISSTSGRALNISCTATTDNGIVISSSVGGNGFYYSNTENVGSRGIYSAQTNNGANNILPCAEFHHDGHSNVGAVSIHSTHASRGLYLDQQGTGEAIYLVNSGSGQSIYISQSGDGSGIDIFYSGTGVAHKIASSDAGASYSLQIDHVSNTPALQINKNNTGEAIAIYNHKDTASLISGISFDLQNATGLEYAFDFQGSEIVASAVGATQDKKIRIRIGANTYFIPCHTT